jgi:hypothetical protein
MTKTETDKETVLLALDQLSQTMDVMRQVVTRLKHRVEQAGVVPESQQPNTRCLRSSPKGNRHSAATQTDGTPPVTASNGPIVLH